MTCLRRSSFSVASILVRRSRSCLVLMVFGFASIQRVESRRREFQPVIAPPNAPGHVLIGGLQQPPPGLIHSVFTAHIGPERHAPAVLSEELHRGAGHPARSEEHT